MFLSADRLELYLLNVALALRLLSSFTRPDYQIAHNYAIDYADLLEGCSLGDMDSPNAMHTELRPRMLRRYFTEYTAAGKLAQFKSE